MRKLSDGVATLTVDSAILARLEARVRVSDVITKCAVFLGVLDEHGEFKPIGTGFIVAKLCPPPAQDRSLQYIVTAQHCVVGATQIRLRVNKLDGQAFVTDPVPDGGWYFHPESDRRFVDVAVLPIQLAKDYFDIRHVFMDSDVADEKILQEKDIGIGDEVFFPGLFMHHKGTEKNLPILRVGTVALMSQEPVQTRSGPIKAHLIESRSIGGHSGSPVFLNMTAPRKYADKRPAPLPLKQPQAYYLFGLVRGYLKSEDSGEYVSGDEKQDNLWINSGIATVIPASEIAETINQPELEAMRKESAERFRNSSVDVETPAKVTRIPADETSDENPNARGDFMRLQAVAARKPKQDGQT